jgi:hypothetical protein
MREKCREGRCDGSREAERAGRENEEPHMAGGGSGWKAGKEITSFAPGTPYVSLRTDAQCWRSDADVFKQTVDKGAFFVRTGTCHKPSSMYPLFSAPSPPTTPILILTLPFTLCRLHRRQQSGRDCVHDRVLHRDTEEGQEGNAERGQLNHHPFSPQLPCD